MHTSQRARRRKKSKKIPPGCDMPNRLTRWEQGGNAFVEIFHLASYEKNQPELYLKVNLLTWNSAQKRPLEAPKWENQGYLTHFGTPGGLRSQILGYFCGRFRTYLTSTWLFNISFFIWVVKYSTGWWPPIGGCKSFWKVLWTGMTNWADSFAQNPFST